jgi:hypothetical protein
MNWIEYGIVGVAAFFAGGWALGLALSARNRTGGNIITVATWWAILSAWFIGDFSAFHLLWAFPLALVLPALLLFKLGRL